jgi:hypothetical protein
MSSQSSNSSAYIASLPITENIAPTTERAPTPFPTLITELEEEVCQTTPPDSYDKLLNLIKVLYSLGQTFQGIQEAVNDIQQTLRTIEPVMGGIGRFMGQRALVTH